MKKPNEINWSELSFAYIQTPYNVRCTWKNGAWGPITTHTEETIPLHMAASCLHYGQEAFEGLKAFNCPDGKIRLFRADKNAERLISSAKYLCMAQPTVELFLDMCQQLITLNREYVPPFTSGGSLYIRPVLIGSGATVGVRPADEYTLIIFCTPVGAYFKGGMRGIRAIVDANHDRAAPHGTGHVKAGGNYAASLLSGIEAHDKGYDSAIYLDPATHTNIDECGAANFFGIKDNTYVTPQSQSVLPSITNLSLCEIAESFGMKVERREVTVAELATFTEAGACGTAAVITPIAHVFDPRNGKEYNFDCIGETTKRLYDKYKAIQLGTEPDPASWNIVIE